ncbi:MAG: dihydrolipoamide acetyltransferase family protein [Desulfobacteraceae bacterium]|jgi:pyruvate dehydrogenase E2 component (dihydrolipoamide acetyltransferase)|nr:dihydrolipoamide acetyltransferase family protein [Desulfobacteraceae bacterium]
MTKSFKLPDLGEGIHEGEVLAVPVDVGQEVKEGDIIIEVETDKAAVEIPSPYSGSIQEILVKPGDIVNVGDEMMTFSDGEDLQAVKEEKPGRMPDTPSETAVTDSRVAAAPKEGPVPASPATRRLARELGVDLHAVTPTGPVGLVTAEDVQQFAQEGKVAGDVPVPPQSAPDEIQPSPISEPPLPDFTRWGSVERVPFRSIRRATAKQMTLSWALIPHVNSQDVVDITNLEAFRQKHKTEIESAGGKLSLTVFALKAIATALKTHPNFNATLDMANSEIIIKQYYNIGVAVNTDRGLIVPVVRDVDRKSIRELSIELNDLVQRTRSRKTTLEELQGGTFTITNAGAMGGGFFAPIINYPEVAILGLGQARMQPVVRDQGKGDFQIVPRLMMPVVLCIDHRVLDGADAIKFLRVLVDALEDPDELFLSMV